MSYVVVGLNHRTVPLGVLESMTVAPANVAKALHDLSSREHLSEVVVLSTCARTEVYAAVGRYHGAMADLRNFLAEWSGTPPESFSDHLYAYYDDAAVAHLFRVAAGVDSMVIGESEIVHQVRRAWEAARAAEASGPGMDRLFRHALQVAKRARSETGIARGTTSLSQAAVAMAMQRLGSLQDRTVLLIGAGEMGEGMAEALAGAPGIGQVLVTNRTWAKATALAARFGGTAVPLDQLPDALTRADVVLTSTGAPGIVLDRSDLEGVVGARAARPLLIVDIAVPRDVDPGVGELAGVTCLDMDDLKAFAEAGMADRRREIPLVDAIVAEEVDRYLTRSAERQHAPLVAALHDLGESIRTSELSHYDARLRGLDDRQRAAVEGVTKAIVAKLLHSPTVAIKEAAGSGRAEHLAETVRSLFDL